jgi:hypothetical protein
VGADLVGGRFSGGRVSEDGRVPTCGRKNKHT